MSGFQIVCRDEAATCQLGETLALAVRCGDLITLEGDLGAGKTTLARALLRNAADDPQMEVPSPTFTLVQSYEDLSIGNFTHLDLYRLESGSELEELGVEEALGGGVVLVEWPEKADGALPQATLNITLQQGDRDEARNIGFSGTPAALDRVKRSLAIREFLDANGHRESPRYHLTGDASARAYETIRAKGGGRSHIDEFTRHAGRPANQRWFTLQQDRQSGRRCAGFYRGCAVVGKTRFSGTAYPRHGHRTGNFAD